MCNKLSDASLITLFKTNRWTELHMAASPGVRGRDITDSSMRGIRLRIMYRIIRRSMPMIDIALAKVGTHLRVLDVSGQWGITYDGICEVLRRCPRLAFLHIVDVVTLPYAYALHHNHIYVDCYITLLFDYC